MDGYQFCISCRNVTLGVFSTMTKAIAAILITRPDAICVMNDHRTYAEYASPHHLFTVVACRMSDKVEPLFKE
jgi:hypothetical protein